MCVHPETNNPVDIRDDRPVNPRPMAVTPQSEYKHPRQKKCEFCGRPVFGSVDVCTVCEKELIG